MEETKNQVVAPNEEQTVEVAKVNNFKQIVKELLGTGNCRKFNDVRIKNVNVSEEDNYTRVAFTLGDKIPARIANENGEYVDGERNILFSSTFALAGILKENEDYAWMANTLVENPKAINIILNGGTIDILQQKIAEGEPYHNPFTTREEVEDVVFDHDTLINYIVGVKLGKTGQKYADVLAVKMMGF